MFGSANDCRKEFVMIQIVSCFKARRYLSRVYPYPLNFRCSECHRGGDLPAVERSAELFNEGTLTLDTKEKVVMCPVCKTGKLEYKRE